jgi:hypothetical protein
VTPDGEPYVRKYLKLRQPSNIVDIVVAAVIAGKSILTKLLQIEKAPASPVVLANKVDVEADGKITDFKAKQLAKADDNDDIEPEEGIVIDFRLTQFKKALAKLVDAGIVSGKMTFCNERQPLNILVI